MSGSLVMETSSSSAQPVTLAGHGLSAPQANVLMAEYFLLMEEKSALRAMKLFQIASTQNARM